MKLALTTLRARLLLSSGALTAGIIAMAGLALASLVALRQSVNQEMTALSQVASLTTDFLAAAFDEIRAGEQYLVTPSNEVRDQFARAADETYDYERRLGELPGLAAEDRGVVARIGELQQGVHARYSYVHALLALGRREQALAAAVGARVPATEMMRLLRALSTDQSVRAEQTGAGLLARANERELLVWVVLGLSIVLAGGISVATIRSVTEPTERLGQAARRFGTGDLRPVHLGTMPRELSALGEAIGHVGTRLRGLVQDVINESERTSATATDLSAVSEELAATAGEISTAMVEVSRGAERQVGGLEHGRHAGERLAEAAARNAELAQRVAERGAEACIARARAGPDGMTLDPDDAFWTLLLHCVLDKQSIRAEHLDRLAQLAADATAGGPVARYLAPLLPDDLGPDRIRSMASRDAGTCCAS